MNLDVITERKLPDLPPRFALYAGAAVGVLATGLAILLAAGGGDGNSTVESAIARQAEGVRQTTQRLSSLFEPRPIPVDLGSPALAAAHNAPRDLASSGTGSASGSSAVPPGALVIAADGPSDSAAASTFLIPTYSWVNAFSPRSVLYGEPLPAGSIITAYDPDGVLIGRATVVNDGSFGLMALYMDDPATPIDEGALPGDLMTFRIDGIPAEVTGPHDPVWTENGALLIIDLTVDRTEALSN